MAKPVLKDHQDIMQTMILLRLQHQRLLDRTEQHVDDLLLNADVSEKSFLFVYFLDSLLVSLTSVNTTPPSE